MTAPDRLQRGYSTLLQLYPAGFRARFGLEMQEVFTQAAQDAVIAGWWAVWLLWWRELRDFPLALIRQYWLSWHTEEKIMSEPVKDHIGTAPASSTSGMQSGRPSVGEIAMTVLPLLIWGIAWIYAGVIDIYPMLAASLQPFTGYLVAHAITLVSIGVGWWLKFPSWSYLSVGLGLSFTIYLAGAGMKGFPLLGVENIASGRWSWLAWVPLLMLAIIMLLLTRSIQPLKSLLDGIWKDWSRLSLALYGWLVFLLMTIVCDSIELPNEIWQPALMVVAFIGGVILYLLAVQPWYRALGLDIGLLVGIGTVILVGRIFYPDVARFASLAEVPPDGRVIFFVGVGAWALVCFGLVFLPALLVMLQRTKKVAPVS